MKSEKSLLKIITLFSVITLGASAMLFKVPESTEVIANNI